MKKFLSLVLALIMTMSLVTVSAGAKDFTDDESLNYAEAVAVMSEIGVIDGYPDGSFKPQNGLTRGAAAKIICNMILGPTTASALRADTAPFKDVPADNQYAGYIAYCVQQGITAGYTDGTYRPAAPLTNFAFMKMLLGALGYDQNTEGYVGGNCFINVAKQAIGLGLNKGLLVDFDGGKQITREEAALFAFNTLQATMVEYDEKTTINVGGAQVTLSGKAQDVAWGTATLNDGNIKKDGFVQFAEKHFPKLVKKATTDVFGRPAYIWSNNKKDLGTYVDYTKMVAEYTTGVEGRDVYKDAGTILLDDDYTLDVWVDGVENDDITKTDLRKTNDKDLAGTGNGVLTQVFVDNDEEIVTITEINTYLAKTDDYNEKKETLSLEAYGYGIPKAVKLEDIPAIEGYEDGDMVLVTIANDVVQTIIDPETIEDATLSSFAKGKYVTADSTKYEYNEIVVYKAGTLDNYDNENLKDTTYNIWLDTYGYLIGIEKVSDKTQYVFVTGYDVSTSHTASAYATANVIFPDGTQDNVKVNMVKSTFKTGNSWVGKEGEELENSWYTYKVDANGVYTLKYVANQFHAQNATAGDGTNDVVNKSHVALKATDANYAGENNYYYAYSKTDFVVAELYALNGLEGTGIIQKAKSHVTGVENAKLKIYTEGEAKATLDKDLNNAFTGENCSEGVYGVYKNGYIVAAIVVGKNEAVSTSYAFLDGAPNLEKVDADFYYWDMDAVIMGKKTEITIKSELPIDDEIDPGLYELEYDADGYVIDIKDVTDFGDIDTLPTAKDLIIDSFANDPVELELDGHTLWVTDQTSRRGFFMGNPSCPAAVVSFDGDDVDSITDYTNVEKAIKYLNLTEADDSTTANPKWVFTGSIYMTLDDGVVTSIILTDVAVAEEEEAGDNHKVTAAYDGNFTYTITITDDCEPTYLEIADAVKAEMNRKGATDVKVTFDADGLKTVTFITKGGTPVTLSKEEGTLSIVPGDAEG